MGPSTVEGYAGIASTTRRRKSHVGGWEWIAGEKHDLRKEESIGRGNRQMKGGPVELINIVIMLSMLHFMFYAIAGPETESRKPNYLGSSCKDDDTINVSIL